MATYLRRFCPTRRTMGSMIVAILVGACMPQSRPSPPTPPPIEPGSGSVDAVTWVDVSLLPDGGDVYRIEHIAASSSDLVAIGYDEAGPGSQGAIWHSSDGVAFERVDDDRTAGVVLTDVAAGPGGFVAVGSEGTAPDVVVLVSTDGLSWERASAEPALASATVSAIAAGPEWVMIGADSGGDPISWVSLDGLDWDRRGANVLGLGRGAALIDVAAVRDFWLAAGAERDGIGALFGSDDGERWRTISIPSAENGASPTRLSEIAVSATAMIARGQVVPSCDLFVECAPVVAGWWSTDGESWTALPDTEALASPSVIVPSVSGFLSIAGSRAYTSASGLSWSPLSEPGDDNVLIHDAVVFDDSVIVVGERTSTTGRSEPWLANGAMTIGAARMTIGAAR